MGTHISLHTACIDFDDLESFILFVSSKLIFKSKAVLKWDIDKFVEWFKDT